MKHILNNLSDEEKNSIREQHMGGMKVVTENFSKLINSKLGDVKPLVSEQTQTLPTSGETTTNPFKNQSLLNKFVGKQFQTYNEKGPEGTYEIKKAYFLQNDVMFDLNNGQKASYDCALPDTLLLTLNYDNVLIGKKQYGTSVSAPSLTKELKQTFCTVGSGGHIVPKVDYPTP